MPQLYDQPDVRNLHVRSIAERADASIVNVLKDESANSQELRPHSEQRLRSYIRELREFTEWVQSRPLLDLPKSHPNPLILDYTAQTTSRHIQNRSMRDFASLLEAVIVELVESESAMLASGLQAYDANRVDALYDQADQLIDFMVAEEPIDKPESSPHAPEVESGSSNSNPKH